jgi:hypothetical protein
LNESKNQVQMAGKGHNELYEIVNPMVHALAANAVVRRHAPENRDTRANVFV